MKYAFLAATVIFTVYGQLILKWRISQYENIPSPLLDKFIFLLQLLVDPYIFSGLAAAFISALFWMAAISQFDVSYAYPFITAGLTIVTVLMAVFVLNEPLTVAKAAGITLIGLGIVTIGMGK